MDSEHPCTNLKPPVEDFLGTVLDDNLQKLQFRVFWWFSKAGW